MDSKQSVSLQRKTIFCDIDGTIFWHQEKLSYMTIGNGSTTENARLILGDWHDKDYYIILTTSRPESTRTKTESQLLTNGIFYDKLIMGLPRGCRVVINDRKPDGMVTAEAYCIERNKGLGEVNL